MLMIKRAWWQGGIVAVGLAVLVPAVVFAAASVTQGFRATTTLASGTLVSLQTNDSGLVAPSTLASASRLVGVVADVSSLAISDKDQTTQVATSGTAVALVSDINGPVHSGDKIVPSPIDGVGMKATADGQIIGTAAADLVVAQADNRTIQDAGGKSHTVHIAQVPVQINIGYYVVPGSKLLPPFIQNIANNIAGRPVSLLRVLFATLLLAATFTGVSIILYVVMRSGMAALGRNPLAGAIIRRGMLETVIAVALLFVLGMVAAYLILAL